MKKNFYAVALALATACTTFVGCKDYDSDIKDLQTQIDTNKSAIEALQQAIANGSTITGGFRRQTVTRSPSRTARRST